MLIALICLCFAAMMLHEAWGNYTEVVTSIPDTHFSDAMSALNEAKLDTERRFRHDMSLMHLYHPGSAGAGPAESGLAGAKDEPDELVGHLKLLYAVPESDGDAESMDQAGLGLDLLEELPPA